MIKSITLLGLLTLPTYPALTINAGSISQVTSVSDIDLNGNIVYAVNISSDSLSHIVSGVTFTNDAATVGFSQSATNAINAWQTKPELGVTTDANALESIYEDIRWSNASLVTANFDVTSGNEYKLQILFYGNRVEDRRFDIQVEGVNVVDETNSLGNVAYSANAGTLYTYTFTAGDSTANVSMGSIFGDSDGGDRNPIWQGLILEDVTPVPEPSSLVLASLSGLILLGRRKRA